MDTNIVTDGGYNVAIMNDNHIMTGSTPSPWWRILWAPFTRRVWAELGYTLVSFPIAIAGVVYTAVTLEHGMLWALSAPGMRRLAGANRVVARRLLGEDIPAPPGLGSPRP